MTVTLTLIIYIVIVQEVNRCHTYRSAVAVFQARLTQLSFSVMTRPKPSMAPELKSQSSPPVPFHPVPVTRGIGGRGKANGGLTKVEVRHLHHSDLMESCDDFFSCGRFVSDLVQDLLDEKVSLDAPFLRLTVFESATLKNNRPVLRCIDNRRLAALKEYAKRSGQDHMEVNVDFFSQFTIMEVRRFIDNSDHTSGHDVRIRRNKRNNQGGLGPKKKQGKTQGKKPVESTFCSHKRQPVVRKRMGAKGSRSDRLLCDWLLMSSKM